MGHYTYILTTLSAVDVQVGFQSPSYVGMESVGRVTVCAVINADIDRSVQLELIAVAGSANGNRI